MEKTLILFDFDHTLYTKDSLLEVTKYIVGNTKFYMGIAVLSPCLIAMKLGLADNAKTKQRYLRYFFKGTDYEYFKKAANTFSLNRIDKDLNLTLKTALYQHLNNNNDVYIVTASFTEWLAPWCAKNSIGLISSKLEIMDGIVTGNISGLNCYGPEKVVRILNVIDTNIYDAIHVYGKGKGDKEMLALKR